MVREEGIINYKKPSRRAEYFEAQHDFDKYKFGILKLTLHQIESSLDFIDRDSDYFLKDDSKDDILDDIKDDTPEPQVHHKKIKLNLSQQQLAVMLHLFKEMGIFTDYDYGSDYFPGRFAEIFKSNFKCKGKGELRDLVYFTTIINRPTKSRYYYATRDVQNKFQKQFEKALNSLADEFLDNTTKIMLSERPSNIDTPLK